MLVLRRVAMLIAPLVAACGGTSVDPTEGPCEDYCRLVVRHCAGTNAQYSAFDNCMGTCRTFEVGDPEVHTGNTIECRTFWAAIAEGGDPAACLAAGPGGNGECGTNCESFCTATLAICEDQEAPPYASFDECLGACAGFATMPPFNADEISGNSLACRIYHMTAAATDPDTHCSHTGVVSATCFTSSSTVQ